MYICICIDIFIYMHRLVGCLLEFFILTAPKIISEWVPTCDSAHSWRRYSAAPLGDLVNGTMN